VWKALPWGKGRLSLKKKKNKLLEGNSSKEEGLSEDHAVTSSRKGISWGRTPITSAKERERGFGARAHGGLGKKNALGPQRNLLRELRSIFRRSRAEGGDLNLFPYHKARLDRYEKKDYHLHARKREGGGITVNKSFICRRREHEESTEFLSRLCLARGG